MKKQTVETVAILQFFSPDEANLYIPTYDWKTLTRILNTNRLTVVLRLPFEYNGELKTTVLARLLLSKQGDET